MWSRDPRGVVNYMQNTLKLTPGDSYNQTYRSKLESVMHGLGVKTWQCDMNAKSMQDHIKSGNKKTVLVCVTAKSMYTNGGHIMALIAANDNSVYVANPNSKTPGGWQSTSTVANYRAYTIMCWE